MYTSKVFILSIVFCAICIIPKSVQESCTSIFKNHSEKWLLLQQSTINDTSEKTIQNYFKNEYIQSKNIHKALIGDLICDIKNYKYASIGSEIKDITLYAVKRYFESNKKEFMNFLKFSDSNPCKEYLKTMMNNTLPPNDQFVKLKIQTMVQNIESELAKLEPSKKNQINCVKKIQTTTSENPQNVTDREIMTITQSPIPRKFVQDEEPNFIKTTPKYPSVYQNKDLQVMCNQAQDIGRLIDTNRFSRMYYKPIQLALYSKSVNDIKVELAEQWKAAELYNKIRSILDFKGTKIPEYKEKKSVVLDCMNSTNHNSAIINEVEKCYDFYKHSEESLFSKYTEFWFSIGNNYFDFKNFENTCEKTTSREKTILETFLRTANTVIDNARKIDLAYATLQRCIYNNTNQAPHLLKENMKKCVFKKQIKNFPICKKPSRSCEAAIKSYEMFPTIFTTEE